ncbi:MAG: metallophosphoesterase family protein [Chloroflexota bacterium]
MTDSDPWEERSKLSGGTNERESVIGVISDTHGLLRSEALRVLHHVERIVHAGDIGSPDVLKQLRDIAPVVAVRGNMDGDAWSYALSRTEVVQAGKVRLYVLHDLSALDLDPAAAGFGAVISGHSHRPSVRHRDGVLYLNPGSAGPRRFDLPVTVALLRIRGDALSAEIVHLIR